MHLFDQIIRKILEKFRAYYSPPQEPSTADWPLSSDKAFAEMLCEIDAFSQQFRVVQPASKRYSDRATPF